MTIRSSMMPPSSFEELGVALLAGLQVRRCRPAPALRAAAAAVSWSGPIRKAWPMCETSNRPACSRVQVLGQDARRVLHRHVIAGERHHAGAQRDMLGMERGASQRLVGGASLGHRKSHRARVPRRPARVQAPSVPGPERFPRRHLPTGYPFGGRRLASRPLSRVPSPCGPFA